MTATLKMDLTESAQPVGEEEREGLKVIVGIVDGILLADGMILADG